MFANSELAKFRSVRDVQAWVDKGGDISLLRHAVELRGFETHPGSIAIRAWIATMDAAAQDESLAAAKLAAEASARAATASEASAKTSKQAVFAAWFAGAVSVVAIIVGIVLALRKS